MKYQVALVLPTAKSSRSRKAVLERSIEKPLHSVNLSTTVAVVVLPVAVVVLPVAIQIIVIVRLQYR